MAATNEKHLQKNSGIIEVVKLPSNLTVLASNLSNVKAVKDEIDALAFVRLSSVIDVEVKEDYSDVIKQETDDNGVIYSWTSPKVTITGSWYELGNPAVLQEIVGKVKVTDASGEFLGNKIDITELPSLIVRITSTDPKTQRIKQDYCIDATFADELIRSYVNPKRAGEIKGTPFTFEWNEGGGIFTFTDQDVE